MQNSGIGNAVNPLLSLADREVCSIPMLLMVGWRGEQGIQDEPQHIKQGRITADLLDVMEIPWFLIDADTPDLGAVIVQAASLMHATMAPVALLVRKDTFSEYRMKKEDVAGYSMGRESVIKCIIDLLEGTEVVVSTTGKTSRELCECRAARGEGHGNDFLMVGSMGHTASIAMGIAHVQSARRIICLDGDGSSIMHMGALGVIGQSGLSNLLHVVINNGAHDSVGGQPTVGFGIDFDRIAEDCGYRHSSFVSEPEALKKAFTKLIHTKAPSLLEIRVNKGARPDLGRPKNSPKENRNALMRFLDLRYYG